MGSPDTGARWESAVQPRECINPECDANWLTLPVFVDKADADRAAAEFERERLAAGVGEARPAEPPCPACEDGYVCRHGEGCLLDEVVVGAPAEEQPDARAAELEGLLDNERLYTAEHRGYAQVVGEENKLLREQLDAAHRETGEYRRMWEETLTKLDAATDALKRLVPILHNSEEAFRNPPSYNDPSLTGYRFEGLASGAALGLRIARAALGVVAAGADSLEANSAKNAEVRGGET